MITYSLRHAIAHDLNQQMMNSIKNNIHKYHGVVAYVVLCICIYYTLVQVAQITDSVIKQIKKKTIGQSAFVFSSI